MSLPPPLALRAMDVPDPRWDEYVLRHSEGTFFHLQGWRRVIERAYGSASHYLFTERDGRITGLVPLFESGGRPFSRALVSVPVGVYGGIIADDGDSARLLADGARAIAERERLAYVEYKTEKRRFDHLATKGDLYFTFRQELFGDRDKQLSAIPRKTRATIREAERAHLKADYNRSDLDAFYDLYALSLRNLGTPMFPKALFEASLEEFPQHSDIVTVRQTGRIIGAVLNYYHRDVMVPFFAGTIPEARDVSINNYLYWYMLETGYERGFRVFDFGRSKVNTGAFSFKKHFGMAPIPLEYQYDLIGTAELPNISPTNPRYQKAIETWRKLPVGLTKVIGPLISRRLP
jgi:FemAB-related protein (PEP-CTERM system-associated)